MHFLRLCRFICLFDNQLGLFSLFVKFSKFCISGKKRSQEQQEGRKYAGGLLQSKPPPANVPPTYSFLFLPHQTCRTKEICLGPPGNDSASRLSIAEQLQILKDHCIKQPRSVSKKEKPGEPTELLGQQCLHEPSHTATSLAAKPSSSHRNIYSKYTAGPNVHRDNIYAQMLYAALYFRHQRCEHFNTWMGLCFPSKYCVAYLFFQNLPLQISVASTDSG